ncbi:TraR/DksA family transcriptional regulator [Candidatus Roizmanbacteria bacterium]|nr:TraR/DksA family transcriptional regulator [Candidatus Roizmanbacteria bacterium]
MDLLTLSADFIAQQKKRLEEEKQKILKQIAEFVKSDPFSDPDHASDNAAVDTDVREQNDHQVIEAQINDLQRRANDIDVVLAKIAKGRYGYCERCGQAIPLPRLKLIPEARFCVKCESDTKK